LRKVNDYLAIFIYMHPIKLNLGSLPKAPQPQLTPVPGAPAPVQPVAPTARPTAVGAQSVPKSPKPKKPTDMVKAETPNKGVSKLKTFLDGRTSKIAKSLNK
jgi:hypothetical protein